MSVSASRSSHSAVDRRAKTVVQGRDQLIAMLDPVGIRGKPRIIGPLNVIHRLAESPPLTIIADREHEMPVGRGKRFVRDNLRMGVPEALRPLAGHQRPLHDIDQRRQRAIGESQVETPALDFLFPLRRTRTFVLLSSLARKPANTLTVV